MPRLQLTAVALAIVLSPSVAWAQLPLPELEGPEFRLAGKDPLEDQLLGLTERVRSTLETRRGELAALRERQARAVPTEPGSEELPPAPGPPIDRLIEMMSSEVGLLERALDLAASAQAELALDVPETIEADFASIRDGAERLTRLEGLGEKRTARTRRLAAIGAAPVGTSTTAMSARIAQQLHRSQQAELEAARAESLQTQISLRLEKDRLEARLRGLKVGPEDLEAAATRVTEAEATETEAKATLEARRTELAPRLVGDPGRSMLARLRQDVARVRIEAAVHVARAAELRTVRARVELLVLTALHSASALSFPSELAPVALEARAAETAEARLEVEARLADLREVLRAESTPPGELRLARRVRDGLEDVLASVAEQGDIIRDTLETIELVQQGIKPHLSEEQWWRAVAWTAILGLVTLLILIRGGRALLRLEHEAREERPDHLSTRLLTAVLLLAPVVLLLGVSAIMIWPIWQLPISVREVLEVTERPLFYVDEEAISARSMVSLLITLWLTLVLSGGVRRFFVDRIFGRLKLDPGTSHTLGTLIHYLFLAVGFTVGLRFVGVGLSSFALFAGILGIGVGFGLRNVTENFISGLIVLFERPVQVEDWITLEDGVEAKVTRIRARSTTVTTRDNVSIIIPNSEFVAKKVTNWSHGDMKVRLRVSVGVSYGSELELVRRTLLEVADNDRRVLSRPSPEVFLDGFGGSSIDFSLLVWTVEQRQRYRLESDLRFAIDAAFRRKQITIAFPQLDLHISSLDDAVVGAVAQRLGQQLDRDDDPLPIPDGTRRDKERSKPLPIPSGTQGS